MKRMWSIAVLAVALTATVAATGEASRHARKSPTVAARPAAAGVCDPSHCNRSGSCPVGGGSAKATSAGSSAKATSAVTSSKANAACPVADPSQCPPACRPASATAVTAVASR